MKIRTYNHNNTLLGEFEYSKEGYKKAYADCVEYVSQTSNLSIIKYNNTILKVITTETLELKNS